MDERGKNPATDPGNPDFLTSTGTDDAGEERPPQRAHESSQRARAQRQETDARQADAGYFGAGSNDSLGDDSERETTPGYQGDKHDRGTIVPH
jgi:hypothetical protein